MCCWSVAMGVGSWGCGTGSRGCVAGSGDFAAWGLLHGGAGWFFTPSSVPVSFAGDDCCCSDGGVKGPVGLVGGGLSVGGRRFRGLSTGGKRIGRLEGVGGLRLFV